MKKGFTLLELIVVIVILGILATLGYTQYTRIVEKGRIAEAVVNFGKIRKYAISYWMENNSFAAMTAADIGIGTGADQMPSSCVSSSYFRYSLHATTSTTYQARAYRCSAGGKPPNITGNGYSLINDVTGPTFSSSCFCWDDVVMAALPWCYP
ncbi:MAG: prepilin-type N-terminal cleavage/methylation domain-containing protein [Candidatus Omnitrophica bacterium]|nr:prepilin-type N-terminal cleavage/methylation domain-containing protein [Candidatus Omnitrophota bacterium]